MKKLIIAGKEFNSRLFLGTGKFNSNTVMEAVSYTHLDVYKRQLPNSTILFVGTKKQTSLLCAAKYALIHKNWIHNDNDLSLIHI